MAIVSPNLILQRLSSTVVKFRDSAISTFQGNAGGLTITGGTAASDDLTLRGSSSATTPWGQLVLQDHLTNIGANTVFSITNPPSLIFDASTSNYNAFAVGSGATWQVNTALAGVFGIGQAALIFNPTIKNQASVAITDLGAQAVFGNTSTTQADGAACTVSFIQSYVHSPTYSVINAGTLTITNERAVSAQNTIGASVTVTNRVGLYFRNKQGSGTQTNAIALDVEDQTVATLGAALRSAIASGTGKWFLLSTGTADSAITGNLRLGDTTAPTTLLDLAGKTTITSAGLVTKYNNIATVSNGVPAEYATVDLTGQSAAKTATTLYTPAATGMFRISIYLQITTAASTSSILGGATGMVITYNDGDGNVAQSDTVALESPTGTVVTTVNTNTTATNLNGTMVIYARTGVAIQYAIGYTSVGLTAMVFAAHLKIEAL